MTKVVGGVDATQDALAAMPACDLDVTVFQDASDEVLDGGSRDRPDARASAGDLVSPNRMANRRVDIDAVEDPVELLG